MLSGSGTERISVPLPLNMISLRSAPSLRFAPFFIIKIKSKAIINKS